MSAISTILARLRAAIWAIDVRDDIANAIEQCYSDVSNPTLKTEALEAALQNKIDQGEMAALTIGDHTITAAKLANGVIPAADATLTETGKPADAAETGRQFGLIKADLDAQDNYTVLLNDEVPNTTQAYTFSNGKVSQVVHSRNSTAVRTDVFTYGASTITEVRTLSTGESLTLETNLTTLETVVTYDGGNE